MSKGGLQGKHSHKKNNHLKKQPGVSMSGRERIQFTEHRKISPKHPNMGKR